MNDMIVHVLAIPSIYISVASYIGVTALHLYSMEGANMDTNYHPATARGNRTFTWSGYQWFAKSSYQEKVGPGPSLFDERNVEMGDDGCLRLWVKNNGVIPVGELESDNASAEIQSIHRLGYGTYQVDVHGCLRGKRWDRMVLGYFVYDLDDAHDGHEELDIEIGTFDGHHPTGGVFSNFNAFEGRKHPLNICPSLTSNIHRLCLTWLPYSVTWTLTDVETDRALNVYTSSERIPQFEGAIFIINLWQFQNRSPQDGAQSIVLRHFRHISSGDPIPPVVFVDCMYFSDGANVFVKGKQYPMKGIALKAIRTMTNVKIRVGTAKDVTALYPNNRSYSGLNGDVVIHGGRIDRAYISLIFNDELRQTLPIVINSDQFPSMIHNIPIMVTEPPV